MPSLKSRSSPRRSQLTARTAPLKVTSGAPRIKSRIAHRIIEDEADIRDGVRALRRKCPVMRSIHDTTGDPPLRRQAAGFSGIARVIVGQQLSVASAAAIWSRTALVCMPFQPAGLLAVSDDILFKAGLSRAKVRTLRAIAAACSNGLDLAKLEHMTEEEVHAALTDVVGIGPWTADVYIMFCLGRADGWASGDLALQIAAQHALALDNRPSAVELTEIAERWRPWRGVAARLLWAYYAAMKQKHTAVPV
jgi:DNA-3-methyladenine glycosylase II